MFQLPTLHMPEKCHVTFVIWKILPPSKNIVGAPPSSHVQKYSGYFLNMMQYYCNFFVFESLDYANSYLQIHQKLLDVINFAIHSANCTKITVFVAGFNACINLIHISLLEGDAPLFLISDWMRQLYPSSCSIGNQLKTVSCLLLQLFAQRQECDFNLSLLVWNKILD